MRSRTLLLHLDLPLSSVAKSEMVTAIVSILGGGFGMEVVRRLFQRRASKEKGEIEFQARILDEGDQFRQMLLEEVRLLREKEDVSRERAHTAEKEVALLKADNARLQLRLERKDEANKGLQAQADQVREICHQNEILQSRVESLEALIRSALPGMIPAVEAPPQENVR